MAKPIANQINSLNQVSQGIKHIIAKQTKIPKIGINGTKGTLNGRSALGSVFLKIKIPAQTITKANKVPILVISPTTFIGTNAANNAIKIQMFYEHVDRYHECGMKLISILIRSCAYTLSLSIKMRCLGAYLV